MRRSIEPRTHLRQVPEPLNQAVGRAHALARERGLVSVPVPPPDLLVPRALLTPERPLQHQRSEAHGSGDEIRLHHGCSVTARARSPDAFALFRCEREREQTSGVRPKTPAAVVARRRAIDRVHLETNEATWRGFYLSTSSSRRARFKKSHSVSCTKYLYLCCTFSPFAPSQANAPRFGYKIPFSTLW